MGGNLLPFALAYPEAEVVGVDVFPSHIERGREIAKEVGARNLQLFALSLADIGPASGLFDYVIVNGMYNWADPTDRANLLRICRENLSPGGLACVTYNTYPGWKAGDVLRDAMVLNAQWSNSSDPKSAREFLSDMVGGVPGSNVSMASLLTMARTLEEMSDHNLALEYLENQNPASYLIEFAGLALQAGLAYVGDANPHTEIASAYGDRVSAAHARMSRGKPRILAQQMLDMLVGREQRASILTHAERQAEVLDAPDTARLADLHFAGCFLQQSEEAGGGYTNQLGRKASISTYRHLAVVDELTCAWPRSLSFSSLNQLLSLPFEEDAGTPGCALSKTLEDFFKQGVLRYSLDEGPYELSRCDRMSLAPGLVPLLVSTLEERPLRVALFNLWHERVSPRFAPSELLLLSHFDEAGGPDELAALLERSELLKLDGDDSSKRRESARAQTMAFLEKAVKAAMLWGSEVAWSRFHHSMLVLGGTALPGALYRSQAFVASTLRARTAGSKVFEAPGSARSASNGKLARREQELQQVKQAQSNEELLVAAARLAREHPESPIGWIEYGNALFSLGQCTELQRVAVEGILSHPLDARMYAGLGNGMLLGDTMYAAIACYRIALKLDANNHVVVKNIAVALFRLGLLADAEEHLLRAMRDWPDDDEIGNNLATLWMSQGKYAEGGALYDKMLCRNPLNLDAQSNRLFAATHRHDLSPEQIFRLHSEYGSFMDRTLRGRRKTVHRNDRTPHRRLRVGFASGDLRQHAVARFFEPTWHALDRTQFDLYVYSEAVREDDVSERIKQGSVGWRRTKGISDQALVKLIQDDQIDILFDLAGHTARNRLPALALKPAPIQLSWIGYPGTTGLEAIDYTFLDPHFAEPGVLDPYYTEKIIYLPEAFSFELGPQQPEANPLPALKNGYVTFGSFNRMSKLSDQTLDLWCSVLRAIPTARMLVGAIEDDASRQALAARFAARGVPEERLAFRKRTTMHDYLLSHHDVDVILDTAPYTGGTTTQHALWMGVPVLTLRGASVPSRQTAALLGYLGLASFIADSVDEYVRQAAHHAGELAELSTLRQQLRTLITKSPACDAVSLARSVERALRMAWIRWCDDAPPVSFSVPANFQNGE